MRMPWPLRAPDPNINLHSCPDSRRAPGEKISLISLRCERTFFRTKIAAPGGAACGATADAGGASVPLVAQKLSPCGFKAAVARRHVTSVVTRLASGFCPNQLSVCLSLCLSLSRVWVSRQRSRFTHTHANHPHTTNAATHHHTHTNKRITTHAQTQHSARAAHYPSAHGSTPHDNWDCCKPACTQRATSPLTTGRDGPAGLSFFPLLSFFVAQGLAYG